MQKNNGIFVISVSTYLKNSALLAFLFSFYRFYKDNGRLEAIHIADDGNNHAKKCIERFERRFFTNKIVYSTGENKGIAKNKNRGIKYFLEKSIADNLILFDDDLIIKHSGLFDRLLDADKEFNIGHITGCLGGTFGQIDDQGNVNFNNPFLDQFPPEASTKYLLFCEGAQGIMNYFTREALTLVGYYDIDWKGRYGYEHSIHSSRLLKLRGRYPKMYPILKNSQKFFVGNYNFPNQYDANPQLNSDQYQKKLIDVFNGINLQNKNPGI